MTEQSSIQVGSVVRGKHTQDSRAFVVDTITTWPHTGERVLHGRQTDISDYGKRVILYPSAVPMQEFEANVEQIA
jgi:hypothetical protein